MNFNLSSDGLENIFLILDLFAMENFISLNPNMVDSNPPPYHSMLITDCRLLSFRLFIPLNPLPFPTELVGYRENIDSWSSSKIIV